MLLQRSLNKSLLRRLSRSRLASMINLARKPIAGQFDAQAIGNDAPVSHECWGSHLSGGGAARQLQGPPKSFRKSSTPCNILIVRHVNQIFGNALVLASKHESSWSFRKLPKALSYYLSGFASRSGPVHFSDTCTFEKKSESPFGPMQAKVLLISVFSSSWRS